MRRRLPPYYHSRVWWRLCWPVTTCPGRRRASDGCADVSPVCNCRIAGRGPRVDSQSWWCARRVERSFMCRWDRCVGIWGVRPDSDGYETPLDDFHCICTAIPHHGCGSGPCSTRPRCCRATSGRQRRNKEVGGGSSCASLDQEQAVVVRTVVVFLVAAWFFADVRHVCVERQRTERRCGGHSAPQSEASRCADGTSAPDSRQWAASRWGKGTAETRR